MADGKLVFPVKFDLQRAVQDAQGDVDKVLRQMQTQINSRPLKIHTDISELKAYEDRLKNLNIPKASVGSGKNMFTAQEGSILALNEAMDKCIKEWNKLAESERIVNRETGEYTAKAKDIIDRYAQLTGASRTYAKNLQMLVSEADKAVKAQEKESQAREKLIAKGQERARMLNAEELSLTAVAQKMKFYQEVASKHDLGTREYQYATKQLERLGAQYERLKAIMNSNTGNNGKDIINSENIKRTLRGAEDSVDQVKAKLKALEQVIDSSKLGSFGWRRAIEESRRLNNLLDFTKKQVQYLKNERVILRFDNSTIANMNAKLAILHKKLQEVSVGGADFKRIAGEIKGITSELEKAQKEVDKLTGKVQKNSGGMRTKISGVTQEYKTQTTYIESLIRRMAVYASVGAIGGFLTKIREVTAQFELQKVSLGAIIQDQAKANALFAEIKSFALKSPVSILDLTKYTKQLAAYKIGVDDLFETTKKLTDVSVGLGVSMDRVVLAYGQVRATGHLRASEIRQFTEMGVPIVEELAQKLSKMNGELVTSAQVMDMVSKRAISFDMVKDVFDDMTEKGGIFYNMQEKQGNTLYGMWAKLGDAASVMYDEIGNTWMINDSMKGLINISTSLMRNWGKVASAVAVLGVAYGTMILKNKVMGSSLIAVVNTTKNASKAHKEYAFAVERGNIVNRKATSLNGAAAIASLKSAQCFRIAAASANGWTAAMLRLKGVLYAVKAALISNVWTIAIAAVGLLVEYLWNLNAAEKELNSNLGEIGEKYALKSLNDADNFKKLAKEALNTASSSKQQKDALDELVRTYGDIVGAENLQIDKLREMGGHYEKLIGLIEEYNIKQK